jgi:hypothetical protein
MERTSDFASLFSQDFHNNKKTYRDQLGGDFTIISNIYDNYAAAAKYYEIRNADSLETAFNFREVAMTNNIRKVISINAPEAKYFGQFGHIHTTQRHIDQVHQLSNWSSTAVRLKEGFDITSYSIGIICSEGLDFTDYQLFGRDLDQFDIKPKTPIIT